MTHYLDNSATTPLCDAARAAVIAVMDENFGNPSSLHSVGVRAQGAIDAARKAVLSSLLPAGTRGKPEQVIFTSGGTEANNLAIIGTATAKPRNSGKKIIIGETEHPSVIASAERLKTLGYKVAFIPSPKGVWDMTVFENELTPDTILVSAMLVNNETGAVNDIAKIAAAARKASPDVIIHCDAVQGYMRLPKSLLFPADIVTVSAHKIGGPKGAGALFASESVIKKKSMIPVIFGGGQEHGLRSGTENVLGIAGFGAAVDYFANNQTSIYSHFDRLYSYAVDRFSALGNDGISLNIPQTERVAHHILSVTAHGVRSETMLHFLSSEGVFVSSGSACSSNTKSRSHVLRSFGLSDDDTDSTLRLSFGLGTTEDDIDAAANAFLKGIKTLSHKRG